MGINATAINHVIVAVEDLDAAVETFTETWGLTLDRRAESAAMGIEMAYFPVGESVLELVMPTTDSESNPTRRQLNRNGEGFYLLCFRVEDIHAAVADLRAKGCTVTDPAGSDEVLEAFVSPKSSHGAGMQLIQHL